jgi:asparagine synthase (glutamine-hydrolysing)
MTDMISHRGPDDSGYWVDIETRIAFGHRRLSIIDLKATGHQPMQSPEGRFIIIYNGEIYNYLELKKELDKAIQTNWRGHSDTEVLLRGFEFWGVKATLQKACGMFALALFDKKEKKLILARDRIGEKPLYYGWLRDAFIFGSELKILKGMGAGRPEIDMESLGAYFRYGYVPAPYCIFKHFKKLLPATYVEIDISNFTQATDITPISYWNAQDHFKIQDKNNLSAYDAQNKLESILERVVEESLIGDVPVGAFLSGGVDSSLIVALMQKINSSKIKTFTIGFHDNQFNEAQHALKVAKHLGTDHTELYCAPKDVFNIIPKLPRIYDEPFADSSQLPTVLLSSLTRSKVTVALSGDGGDELFAGYHRYQITKARLNMKRLMPGYFNKIVAQIILFMTGTLESNNKFLSKAINRARIVASVLKMPNEIIYEDLIALWPLEHNVVPHNAWHSTLQAMHRLKKSDSINQMMYVDIMSYLPDDIMVKVDRAAMSVGLETRAPLLDRRIVEFACSLPINMKMEGRNSKTILKNILYKYVPQHLIDRPKQGFGVPISSWLRGPLKEWAGDMLSSKVMSKHNYLNDSLIEKKWLGHLSCKEDSAAALWTTLMFQAWYNEYMEEAVINA